MRLFWQCGYVRERVVRLFCLLMCVAMFLPFPSLVFFLLWVEQFLFLLFCPPCLFSSLWWQVSLSVLLSLKPKNSWQITRLFIVQCCSFKVIFVTGSVSLIWIKTVEKKRVHENVVFFLWVRLIDVWQRSVWLWCCLSAFGRRVAATATYSSHSHEWIIRRSFCLHMVPQLSHLLFPFLLSLSLDLLVSLFLPLFPLFTALICSSDSWDIWSLPDSLSFTHVLLSTVDD